MIEFIKNLISYWLYQFKLFVFWFLEFVKSIGDWIIDNTMTAAAYYMPAGVNWSLWQSYLDQINWIFPLSECISLGVAYFCLWGVVVGYKAVKSWIPTVAS